MEIAATGAAIADRAVEARSLTERLAGLLGREGLDSGEALWLRANGIHTFGMRFAIDVVVLDGEGRVLRAVERLEANHVVWPVRGGRITLELPAGAIARMGVAVGDRLVRTR